MTEVTVQVNENRGARRGAERCPPRHPVDLGLPHREPFLFLQAVTELVPGESGRAHQTYPAEADFFRGHFPGRPVVPGVLLTEAVAQLAGIVAGAARPGARFFLTAVRNMKFPAAAGPDEELTLSVQQRGVLGGLHQYEGEVCRRDGVVVAAGMIVLSEESEGGQ